jgi:hypothetical protein
MRQPLRRSRWAGAILLALLIGLGLGALSPSASENGLSSWLGERAGRLPSVSTRPPSRQADPRVDAKLVKAFAEIDGRLYRIIVAPRSPLGDPAVPWSAAVSDDQRPR